MLGLREMAMGRPRAASYRRARDSAVGGYPQNCLFDDAFYPTPNRELTLARLTKLMFASGRKQTLVLVGFRADEANFHSVVLGPLHKAIALPISYVRRIR